MSCKHSSRKARAEQDYWLSFSDFNDATEEERLDFLRYDSHGGERPAERIARIRLPFGEMMCGTNPIILGKIRHGQMGHIRGGKRGGLTIDCYFDIKGGWSGGLDTIRAYLIREPFGIRPLREWFGDKTVHRWLSAFLSAAFGWPEQCYRGGTT